MLNKIQIPYKIPQTRYIRHHNHTTYHTTLSPRSGHTGLSAGPLTNQALPASSPCTCVSSACSALPSALCTSVPSYSLGPSWESLAQGAFPDHSKAVPPPPITLPLTSLLTICYYCLSSLSSLLECKLHEGESIACRATVQHHCID